jgi:hypothetical protein
MATPPMNCGTNRKRPSAAAWRSRHASAFGAIGCPMPPAKRKSNDEIGASYRGRWGNGSVLLRLGPNNGESVMIACKVESPSPARVGRKQLKIRFPDLKQTNVSRWRGGARQSRSDSDRLRHSNRTVTVASNWRPISLRRSEHFTKVAF